ncbi:MAG: DUF6588 family protein [Salibacteraceae bacterium]
MVVSKSINHILLLSILLSCQNVFSQVLDFDNKAIEKDFIYNLGLYTENFIGSELDAYSLNKVSLWQTSGKTLQPYAVSVSIQSSTTMLKSSEVSFNFNEVAFSENMELEDPTDPKLPTILGGRTDKNLVYTVRESRTGTKHKQTIPALSGINSPYNAIPSSAIIVGVGLPANTQVNVRFFPTITVYNVRHFEIGGGVKHQFSQYFWKDKIPLNMSVSVRYNYSKYIHYLDDLLDGNDQHVLLKDNIICAEIAASYDKKWFSLFVLGGGYSSSTQFNINGTYSFEVEEDDPVLGVPIIYEAFSTENPVSLTRQSISPKLTLGLALKAAHVAELAFAFSIAEYNTASVNLSFNLNNKP